MISGGFKVSIKGDGQIEIKGLAALNVKQMELPLKQLRGFKKGESVQEEVNTKIDIVKIQMVKDGTIDYGKKRISNPQDLAELGLKFLKNADRETFVLVCLNTKNYVNCIQLVSIGTLDRAVISPREVMKTALLSNAASIAFIHNHPSGDAEPSPEDVHLTKTLASCADLFEIRVLDHVIVVDDGHYESFLEKKILKPAPSSETQRIRERAKEQEERITCKLCGNTYEIRWIEEGDEFNDFGQRYCPFCGLLTQEW
jgi:DNA repair protein RadC